MFLKKIFLKGLVLAMLSFGVASGVDFVLAQSWTEPASAPPAGNVPGVIWNSAVSGSQQSASFYVSGTGRLGQGGAFGNFAPDAVWMVTSPNAYFGNGVAGTLIGAGSGQAAGDISTDGILKANRIRSRGGTYASPGISFSAEPDDGLMITDESGGYHALGLVVGGSPIMVMDTGYVSVYGFGVIGTGFGLPLTLRGYDTTNLATTVAVKIQNAGGELSAAGAKALSVSNGITEEAYFGAGAANPRFVVLGRAGQTGNLFEAKNSAGNTMTVISPSGSVGIGTAGPISPLDLRGTANTTFTNNPIVNTIISTNAFAANMGGGLQFGGVYNSSNAVTTFGYIGGLKENGTDGNYAGKLVFGTRTNGLGAEDMTRMVIGSTGNVGIGTANPGSRLDVAGNINSNADVIATRLCIGADCRNAWPVAGGGGDITGVAVGTGVTGGGASGDVTVSLDTTYTDGRYVNVPGDTMTGSLVISGAGNDLTVADSSAFGTFSPDATWKVSSPNAYFGNGVAGTVIGAGGTQLAGQIKTDGKLTAGKVNAGPGAFFNGGEGFANALNLSGSMDLQGNTLYMNLAGSSGYYLNSQTLSIGWAGAGLITTAGGSLSIAPAGGASLLLQPTSGSVGIGTASPSTNLHVKGTTDVVTLQASNAAGAKFLSFDYADGGASDYGNIQVRPSTLVLQAGNFGGKIQLTPYNGGVYSSSLGLTVETNGNIGIGTASPGSRLDVAGNINSNADVIGARLCIGADCRNVWPGAGGGGDITGVAVGTGVTGGGASGDVTVSLDTTYTDGRYVNVPGDTMTGSLVISGAGNDLTVADSSAFGTFSPDATWKVSSPNAYFGNGVAGTVIGAGGGQNAGDIKTDGNLIVTGNVGIGVAAASAKLQVAANGEILHLSGWTGAPDTYYLGLTSVVGAGTVDYRFRTIDAAGGTRDVLFFDSSTGNVGIGTAAPAYNLDVQGTGSTAYIRAGGLAQTSYTGLDLESNTGSAQIWKNGTGYAGYGGVRSLNIYNSEDFPIAFYQGASERMRINSGGNVGIGVTPGASTKLQVAGMGLFTGGTYNPLDGTPGGVEVGFNTNSNYGFIQSVWTSVAWRDLALNPGGGNVGIGTVSPGSKLDVAGNINSNADVIGTRLCIGADCRNAWPGAGGGGDITGIITNVGSGLAGGAMSGDVTLTLDTAVTDARYVNTWAAGDTMTGSLVISGAGNDLTVADSGAFGGNAPDATWKVSSPNAYFGNGVAGTIIGAGSGQAAGAITTDGNVKIGNDLMVNTADSAVNPGMPWIRSSGAYLVVNSNTGALYLNQDVAQPIYMVQQQVTVAANGNLGVGMAPTRRITLGGTTPQIDFGGGFGYNDVGSPGLFWYSDNIDYGIYKTAGGWNAPNYQQLSLKWPTGIVIDGGSAYGRSGTVLQPSGGNVGIGKYPTTNLDVAGNILSSGDVTGTRLCIGADCRNAWPVAGGGGDMTGVYAGTGMTGGGASGEVTLSLDAPHNDGSAFDSRFINTTGDTMTGLLTAAAAGISLGGVTRTTWPADGSGDITGVVAGNGLTGGGLSGDVTLDVAVGTGIMLVADSVVLDAIWTDGRYINVNGDTMSGLFTAGAAGINLGGVTRTTWPTVTDIWVDTVGDTMTGDLVLSGATTDINVGGAMAMAGAAYPAAGEIATNGDNLYLNSNRTANGAGSYSTAISFYGSSDGFLAFKSDGVSGVAAGALSYFYLSRNLQVNGDIINISNITASGNISSSNGTINNYLTVGGATVNSAYGIRSRGTTAGGYFEDADSGATAYLGYSSYGVYAIGGGAGTVYGLFATASGGTTNWAGYFSNGNVYMANDFYVGATTESIAPPLSFVMDGNDAYFADDVGINGSLIVDTGICSTDAAGECPVLAAGGIYWDIAVVNPFDLAEYILSKHGLEAGEVVVIDPDVDEQVLRSYKANDTAVAGVVSTKPGYLGGQNIEVLAGTQKVMLTLAGRIPVKVTDEGGPIKRGDLLTTSNTPGYAMKCADPSACVGAVVGKAMGELKEGKGTIVVLMSLQ